MSKPIAVCLSDVHFNLQNLELSSKALEAAIDKAESLSVPLVIAGDLHDTKAIIRGEVANRLLSILSGASCRVLILVGNHDMLNEKGEGNALNFLNRLDGPEVVDQVKQVLPIKNLYMVPYQSTVDGVRNAFKDIPKGSIVVMHQGVKSANMGHYIKDDSSIDPEELKDYKIISGHYHMHQTVGTVTYIGSPFTMTFGEANDGPKGFLVLNEDGSFTREILNLRKHVIIECSPGIPEYIEPTAHGDLVWVKFKAPKSELVHFGRKYFADLLKIENFKLDLIPTDSVKVDAPKPGEKELTSLETLDKLIDATPEKPKQKAYLKALAREILNASTPLRSK